MHYQYQGLLVVHSAFALTNFLSFLFHEDSSCLNFTPLLPFSTPFPKRFHNFYQKLYISCNKIYYDFSTTTFCVIENHKLLHKLYLDVLIQLFQSPYRHVNKWLKHETIKVYVFWGY